MVCVVGWDDAPGLTVAPWVLDGIRQAADRCGLEWSWTHLGPADANGPSRRFHPERYRDREEEGRILELELPGARRPRRIPRSWIGRHLCLVVPCLHRRGPGGELAGPLELALERLGRTCALPGDREPARVGARLAGHAFASTTIVVDASWWAPLQSDADAVPVLLSTERCLSTGVSSPHPRWARDVMLDVDRWLAHKLQLAHGPAPTGLQMMGDGASEPWPDGAPYVKARRPGGLANQALEALWSAGRRRAGATRGRLPPSAPGPLGRSWTGYVESRASGVA